MRVRIFKPQFAPLVKSGKKRQTIRPIPERKRDEPKVGDLESWREWMDKPYRSKQRELAAVKLTSVERIAIHPPKRTQMLHVLIDGCVKPFDRLDALAVADGFKDFREMYHWFKDEHGLPFFGNLIKAEDV
jgi:hypothetical protein